MHFIALVNALAVTSLHLLLTIRKCSVKDAAAILTDGEGKRNSGDNPDSENRSRTVPEERKKGVTRSLQPLSYLQPDHECLHHLGLDEETCIEFGAGYAPKGIVRGRLAIPVHDKNGTLVAYCGYAVDDKTPSWIFPKGFDPETQIFNGHTIGEGELVLMRDPLEVMQAMQNGIDNVASFLTETISPQQLKMLTKLMDEKANNSLHLI